MTIDLYKLIISMKKSIYYLLIFLLVFVLANSKVHANDTFLEAVQLHINPTIGNDQNVGTKQLPLKSLCEAAKRINELKGEGAITVFLSDGTYGLSETATFSPTNWTLNKEKRLVIRAEILPDSSAWEPNKMPVIVSTMPFKIETNSKKEITGGSNYGIEINTSHATIQGLRILGEPVHEKPKEGVLIRNYPIVWEGKNLTDLRVTQCLFLGNKFALPNHLGILANGSELNVDHCVFYGVKDAVVMWNNKSENSSMHHNLILNIYGAAVWSWSTTENFKFYNNVLSNINVFWVLDKEEKNTYKLENSLLVGYNQFVNKGGGPQDFGIPANSNKLALNSKFKIKKTGSLEIVEDQTSRYFLQLKPGSKGTEYGAGLFYK